MVNAWTSLHINLNLYTFIVLRPRSQHDLAAKLCLAQNFVIWSRILQLLLANYFSVSNTYSGSITRFWLALVLRQASFPPFSPELYGEEHRQNHAFFYLWIVSAVFSSCYTLTWDLKMDWGLLDAGAGENRFLREEIVYAYKVGGSMMWLWCTCSIVVHLEGKSSMHIRWVGVWCGYGALAALWYIWKGNVYAYKVGGNLMYSGCTWCIYDTIGREMSTHIRWVGLLCGYGSLAALWYIWKGNCLRI